MIRAAALALILLAAAPAHAREVEQGIPIAPPPVAAGPALPSEDEVLLFEVTLDQGTLTDSLQGYSRGDGVLLPIGELARLLDLNIDVRPRERRVVGRIGTTQRPLLIDLASGTARIDRQAVALPPGQAMASLTDIFLDTRVIEQLLPVRIKVDGEGLLVALTATEKLPIQDRLDRLGRLRELRPDVESREDVLWAGTRPGLWSVPAFDIALETSAEKESPTFRNRYDVRIGADVLYTGFEGYVGSDERGRPTATRFTFERRDLEGDMLGPVGATRLALGDVYTPSLAMGARSTGGRGVSVSSAPLEQASVFDRVDLRGELPIGYDVELYINDVLRGGQQTPVQGRYEFLDVPLVRGINVIRIVSYGPRGERFEETRVINVAGGALPKGEATFEFGVVQQETPLVDLRRDGGFIVGSGAGSLRLAAGFGYGLTEQLTVVGGASLYTPGAAGKRKLGTLGLRTSLLGYAVQLDGGYDDTGGYGVGIGAAGTPFGISTILRHSEYGGGFIDEALPSGGDGRELVRHSEATMDFSIGPTLGLTFPFSLRAQRDEYADGRTALIGGFRLSTTTKRFLLSTGLDYDRTILPGQPSLERLVGNFAASTYAGSDWQLRGTLDYEVIPDPDLRAIALTADRNISERLALRFGAGRSFVGGGDSTFQAGAILRLPFADVSLAGDFTSPRNDWRIGLQFAFGLVLDPFSHRYRVTRPGPGTGGNAAVRAFIDRDNDDRFTPAVDEPVPNVVITGGGGETATDAEGRALITGLGNSPTTRLQVNIDGIDNPYVSSPPQYVEFAPRAGTVAEVFYPLKPVGEVLARVRFRDVGGRMTGLSSVKVRAVRDGAPPVEAVTEFDGSVVFERLPAGRYRFELDTAQAERLAMEFVAPVSFEVPPDGGFIPDVVATVVFEKPAAEPPPTPDGAEKTQP